MKSKVEIILIIVMSLCITLSLFYWLRTDFLLQREHLYSTASHSFLKAIDVEKTIKLEGIQLHDAYSSNLSPNSILPGEKNNWCDQSFFIDDDSTRLALDSLFRVELARQDIYVQAAIRCLLKGKTVYSNPDSLFYQQATALPPVVYRLNEKPEGRCELQAYVKIPFLIVLKQMHSVGFIVFFWILSLLIIIGTFCYRRKKQIVMPDNVPMTEKLGSEPIAEEQIVPLIPSAVVWTCLSGNLLFDVECGVLKHKDHEIKLLNNRLLLFRLFISAPNHHLSAKDICAQVLGRKVDKPGKSDSDAIATNIKRLRDDLASFPFIKIQNLRGNGYQLVFECLPD